MTTEEIIQGNKMIAEFMGIGKTVEGALMYFKPDTESYWIFPNELKYHLSWDWLMPVVEKINKMNLRHDRAWHVVTAQQITAPINDIWLCVTEFIQWYNDNLKNQQP